MRYINPHFTYLLTYLYCYRSATVKRRCHSASNQRRYQLSEVGISRIDRNAKNYQLPCWPVYTEHRPKKQDSRINLRVAVLTHVIARKVKSLADATSV